VSDPHIDKTDAKQLIREIVASINKIPEDRFVVVSMTRCSREYEKRLYPVFDNVVRITNDIENSKVLRVNVLKQRNCIGGKRLLSY
jgi:hypothetical protein